MLEKKIRIFLEMIKFEHSIFALPFAYLGLFLASGGWPKWPILGWVTLAMVTFRTAAMALNRLIDQEIDRRNPRTQNRALPAGLLRRSAVWFAVILSIFIFELSAGQLNPLCLSLSWIPLALAVLYPFCKRFTWMSHVLLGLILGIAPYGAWLAAGREFSWIPGLMTLGVMVWVAGFDIIYALQDLKFDQASGLYSVPACFGENTGLICARIFHGLAFVFWAMAGVLAGLGWFYFLGLGLAGFFLIRENWLMKNFGLAKVGQAFFTMNAVVSVSLFVFVLADLLLLRHV